MKNVRLYQRLRIYIRKIVRIIKLSLISIIKSLSLQKNRIDVTELPSMGLFYPKDLEWVEVTPITTGLIELFNNRFKDDNSDVTYINNLNVIKIIVKYVVNMPDGYSYDDISTLDIMYLFIKSVELYTGVVILKDVLFSAKNYNYFDTHKLLQYHKDTYFEINGWRYSHPTIGVENSMIDYLIKTGERDINPEYLNFIYFQNGKNKLEFNEINNLIDLWKHMSEENRNEMNDCIFKFKDWNKHSLLNENGEKVEILSNLYSIL